MRDLESPPFVVGDVAYTEPAPGGFASAAAVPTDPAFGGSDAAFAVPSLGGDFAPGSGAPAPTDSITAKGADADGGAQAIADAERIDEPTPPTPDPPAQLSGAVSGSFVVFAGVASLAGTVDVSFTVGTLTHVITNVAIDDTAAVVAANVARRLNENGLVEAVQTSNGVQVLDRDGTSVTGLAVVVTLA